MAVFTASFEEVVVQSVGRANLDAAELLELADSLLDKSLLKELAAAADKGSTTGVGGKASCHQTEEVSWRVRSSRDHILALACDIALREGFSSVQWKGNFSALHLAAKLGSPEFARLLLQKAHATQGLVLRDDFGKLPVDYALALPQVDLELLDLLEPSQVTAMATSRPSTHGKTPAAAARPPASQSPRRIANVEVYPRRLPEPPQEHQARRAAPARSQKTASGNQATLPASGNQATLPEKVPLESGTFLKSKETHMGSRAQADGGLPTLLGSHGLSRQAPSGGQIPGQLLARELHNTGDNRRTNA